MNLFKSIVCTSIIFIGSACSDSDSARTYISNAEALIVEKQSSEAIISLKNALKVEPKNAKARFLLGRLYLNQGDGEKAVKELERANKLKFNANKVIPLLARAYMLEESDEEILSLASQKNFNSNTNTQYLAYKTIASVRTSDKALAEEAVNLALSISESDRYSMLASAYLEFSKQNTARAKTLVEQILLTTPEATEALMLQGQIAIINKQYSIAVDSFEKYAKLQPSSGKVQLFIADALIKNGQYKEAEAIADTILAKVPRQPFLQSIKATARFEFKDYEAANRLASQALNSGFNSFSLKLIAGASAFYTKNYEQTHHHLKDLIPYISVDHPARRMLALSQLKLGLIDDISDTLGDYNSSSKESTQFLATLSYELLEVGAYEKAQELANYTSNAKGMSAEEIARNGVLKLMMNDPSGIEKLELALQQNPELISAELALAFASIKSGNLTRATSISNKWLKQYPEKAGGHNLQATILLEQNKLEQAKTALEESLKIEPNNAFALILSVRLAAHKNDVEQARVLTEQALKAHPNNIEVLRQYFDFHKSEAGLAVITKVQQDDPKNITYGILLAEALIKLEQFKQASSVLDSYPLTAKTPKRYWQLALAANAKQPDGKDAHSILDKWQKNSPYHIEPVFLLVNYWTSKSSPDRAIAILKEASKKHPNNLMILLVKMQVLLKDRRIYDAKLLLEQLNAFDVDENLLAGIEGRILLLERKFSLAVTKLQQHYRAKPTSSTATFLAYALEGNNQKAEAIELLEQFSSKETQGNKVSPRVQLSLANMYLAKHQDKAIAEYERLIKVMPENIVALNNLSWLYMDNGKLPQALKYSKQAYALNAEIPNVVDTYAQALLKSDMKAEALMKAKEAYTLSKGKNIDIALNYVEILLVNSKNKEARSLLTDISAETVEQKEKKQRLLK
jgi:putative PEP-CTERM system TPR-repeat lipoprotein